MRAQGCNIVVIDSPWFKAISEGQHKRRGNAANL